YTAPVSLVGSWQHFAVVASQSGNFMQIYRNGVLEASKTGMTPYRRRGLDITLSGYLNGSLYGVLDEFRIWNVVRSQAQIQANMTRPLSLPQTNLVAYWRLDEGTGGSVYDFSGHGST